MTYAIILAGGEGSRFWPLSKADSPKQFLNICSDKPLLFQTVKRITKVLPKKNIYIATNKIYRKKTIDCLGKSEFPLGNILLEPVSRNTLAPIGVLSRLICNKDKEAVIMVLPSDHCINNEPGLLKALNKAVNAAKKGHIVTLGVVPDKPETGFGYIKVKSVVSSQYSGVREVEKFIEKPDLQKAKIFIKDKRYYWNAGIFIFKAAVLLDEIKRLAPKAHKIIVKLNCMKDAYNLWGKLPAISIDYAIMEKAKKLALIPAKFDWVDLGSWQAMELFFKKNKFGNILKGNCLDIDSVNSLVWSEGRLTATLGLRDLIVVNTKNALLVCAKDKAQDVKKIVRELKQRKLYR